MKLWYIALLLSFLSCIILMVIYFLPDTITVFDWSKTQVEAGVLFPFLLVSWAVSLFSFLFNNIYIDNRMLDNDAKPISDFKANLPSIFCLPALISFIWFIIRWFKGKPLE